MKKGNRKSPTLDIVLVNWNAGPFLKTCLESVARADHEGFVLSRVVVVDNGSTDGSLEGIEEEPLPLILARNGTNRGFGAACNQGAKGSRADYLLFLNPDMVLERGSLSRPVACMENPECPTTGILGIQLVDGSGKVSRTCARFPKPRHFLSQMLGLNKISPRVFPTHLMEEWDHGENRGVDHVMGAFFLIRRSLFEALEGFDERFFVYLEDLDLSRRVSLAGWRSYYLADARAFHKGGGTSDQIRARRVFYALQSRILYGCKHFARGPATGLLLGTLLLEPLARMFQAIFMRSPSMCRETLRAFHLLWGNLPRMGSGNVTRKKAS